MSGISLDDILASVRIEVDNTDSSWLDAVEAGEVKDDEFGEDRRHPA
jgi:hypothetical protein